MEVDEDDEEEDDEEVVNTKEVEDASAEDDCNDAVDNVGVATATLVFEISLLAACAIDAEVNGSVGPDENEEDEDEEDDDAEDGRDACITALEVDDG